MSVHNAEVSKLFATATFFEIPKICQKLKIFDDLIFLRYRQNVLSLP